VFWSCLLIFHRVGWASYCNVRFDSVSRQDLAGGGADGFTPRHRWFVVVATATGILTLCGIGLSFPQSKRASDQSVAVGWQWRVVVLSAIASGPFRLADVE
jgi:hypothetical protein